jgi:hypothetical protein
MGFFDFLNPQRAIERELSRVAEGKIGAKLAELRAIPDRIARRRRLFHMVESEVRFQASDYIPRSLRRHSETIIENATRRLVDEIDEELS